MSDSDAGRDSGARLSLAEAKRMTMRRDDNASVDFQELKRGVSSGQASPPSVPCLWKDLKQTTHTCLSSMQVLQLDAD